MMTKTNRPLVRRKQISKLLDPSRMANIYIYIYFLQVWEKSVGRRRQALAPDTIRDAHLHSLALPETPSGLVGWLIGGPWAESYVEVEGLLSSHEADFIYQQRVDNL